MSSPFQVVSSTMASTKNPFEKLSQSSAFASPSSRGSASLPQEYSGLNIKENDESEDEIMDPNKTLQMFSFSQPSLPKADPEPEESDDEDEDVNEEEGQPIKEQLLDEKKPSPFDSQKRTRRPHLQEALEMSLNRKSVATKELEHATLGLDVEDKHFYYFSGRPVLVRSAVVERRQCRPAVVQLGATPKISDIDDRPRKREEAVIGSSVPLDLPNECSLDPAEIDFVQLPDITGVKAVQSFSSKHDLEGSEDDEPNELYISKCRAVNRPVEGAERVQKEYRVEIQGTLLPLAVKVLWAVFTERLLTGCSFNATSDVRSHGLNLRPLLHESSSSDDGEVFVSPKALDQLRFDKDSNEYAWPTVDKGVV
ncbi:hypothetical protein BG000_006573 [Podila horticola]|nr:hypothetical protein BG000_006573 [Podila horticola]